MEGQESPSSSTPANLRTFIVEEGQKKMEKSTSPSALIDSELATCEQSMIVDAEENSNTSMETNVTSNSSNLVPETPPTRKLRSSNEWEPYQVIIR